MSLMKSWGALLLLAVLNVGCGTGASPEAPHAENEISYLLQAENYYREYVENNQKNALRKAMETIEKADDLAPDNLRVTNSYYYIAERYVVLIDDDRKILKKMHEKYPRMKAAGMTLAPPSFIEYLIRRGQKAPMKEQIALLDQAMEEKDTVEQIYNDLSMMLIATDQPDRAMAVAQKGLEKGFENDTLHAASALARFYKLHELEAQDRCPVAGTTLDEEGLQEALKALQLAPKRTGMLEYAQEGYEFIGKRDMALEFAKKRYAAEGNVDTYIVALAGNGRLDEAKRLLGSHKNAVPMSTQAMVAFYDRQWLQAAASFKAAKRSDFHDYLKYAMAVAMNGDRDGARAIVAAIPRAVPVTEWDSSLKQYYLGKLTSELLMERAVNACRKSEALFLFGMQAWAEGAKERARNYFDAVHKLGMYADAEYIAVDYWLRNW